MNKFAASISRMLAVAAIGFVSGLAGLVGGTLFGGNYAEQFVFNGVRGYEATGQLGMLLGAIAGLIAGWYFLSRKQK